MALCYYNYIGSLYIFNLMYVYKFITAAAYSLYPQYYGVKNPECVNAVSLGEKEVEWRLIKKFTLPVPSCYYFLVKLKQECDKNDWLKHCYGLTDLTTKENENKTSIKTGFCYDVQDFIYLELWGRQKWIEKVS